ncbi:MAG: hypothetical protein IJW46_06500, partial [Clostridia bacterium]|nr:hypothetical protein [Clostridia bacterium]
MKSRHILSMLLAVVLVIATLSLVSFSVSAAATEIASAEAFMAMTDGEYKLTQNIDLTEAGTLASFKGTLDGGGYTVTVSAPVFGELSGTVKNLTVAGEIAISGTTTVGALANTANGATVEGVTSTVTMTGSANGDYLRASGIIGTANATTVKGSTFSGSINVSALEHKENDNGIGGIAGHISQGSLITDCVNTGSIATSAKAKSNRGAQGGIVGFAQGSTITRCVNKGALSSDASSFCVGGILGRTQPTVQSDNSHIVHISYCANYGSVTKTNSGGELAGGIAAYYRQGSVKYSYNVGTISNSNGQCGGIFGYINAEKGGIEISYNYNIGSCKHGIGFAKNDNSVTSQDNYYLASAASDGTPFGSDGNFKGNFKATAVADAAALNAAVLALSETPFVVDPASNNGYAVFSWQCTHSGDKTPSCEGNKCAICGVLVDNNGTGEHSYPDEWTTIDEATVTADGSAERSCTGCGNTETKVLDALGKITPTDGVYAVSTEDQMLWLVAGINNGSVAANASIAIKEDITLTNGMDMITPTFKGTVDGEGHTVSGLTNTLFKRTGDGFTLKNLTMNGDIDYSALANDSQRTTASVTLYAEAGYTIENVVSNVNIKVSATDLNAGGIMGFANAGTVKNTTYAGEYTINWTAGKGGAVGAIVGWLNDNGAKAYITDCAFTGEFTLTNSEKNDNALY